LLRPEPRRREGPDRSRGPDPPLRSRRAPSLHDPQPAAPPPARPVRDARRERVPVHLRDPERPVALRLPHDRPHGDPLDGTRFPGRLPEAGPARSVHGQPALHPRAPAGSRSAERGAPPIGSSSSTSRARTTHASIRAEGTTSTSTTWAVREPSGGSASRSTSLVGLLARPLRVPITALYPFLDNLVFMRTGAGADRVR
jgi:hypothetical protein